MSYFDDASLVMIPSGYKTSKVYSVKPTDGSGDLTFSRSNDTATRVNSAGLIEKVRTNVYPKNIGLLSGYTLGANASDGGQVEGPTGLMDARRIVMSVASNAFVNLSMTLPAAGQYTFSVWVKLVSGTPLNSPVQYSGLGVNVFMNALPTSTWTRVYGTVTVPSGGLFTLVHPFYDSVATIDYAQVQIETGDIATDYIATTSAAVSVGPVANVPRLDYLNSSCPRLLLEPQRTNLVTYSEQLNTGSGGTSAVTANTAVSPDGYTNADTIGAGYWTKSTSQAAGTYTLSVFAKYQSTASILLYIYDGAYYQGSFNLQTGVATTSTGSPTVSMVSYGNGWYRCIVTATTASTISEVGFGSGNFYGYGLQLEAGAYATSYIPTLAASVTRGADACSKTGISSLIGQTEGTFFAEVTLLGNTGNFNVLNTNNVTTNSITLHIEGSQVRGYVYANSVLRNSIIGGSLSVGNTYKMAYAYKSGDAALYLNGVQIGTASQTWAFSASVDKIELADPDTYFSYQEGIKFAQAILFPTRLSNAALAALTA